MEKTYSWQDLFERAMDTGYGDANLVAKDEARWQVTQDMLENGFSDPDEDECPEDSIENYCDMYGVEFDESGRIIGYNIPSTIAERIYEQKQSEYLTQDIVNAINEMGLEANDEQIDEIMAIYEHDADCNIAYNTTIENAIQRVLNK